jgi:hypothetical protein
MIDILYSNYFQKSKSFLFPTLGITKYNSSPEFIYGNKNDKHIQTYISLNESIQPTDRKLICMIDHRETLRFEKFENNFLFSNPLYHDSIINPGKPSLYIFNLEPFKNDWDTFLQGKYSQLSEELKLLIKNYYGENTKEYEYIDSYLYPKKYYDLYSQLLDIPKSEIIKVGELCDVCDLEKETLIYSTEVLEMS